MAFLRTVFAKPKAVTRSRELLVAKIVVLPVAFWTWILNHRFQLASSTGKNGALVIAGTQINCFFSSFFLRESNVTRVVS